MPIQKAFPQTLTSDDLTCFSPLFSVLTLVITNHATTCSLDPIPSPLLQYISHNILPFLTTLINSSLISGITPAPDIWNYIHVSLLLFLTKTLEHAVYNQLSPYLSENGLIDSNQSGFRTAHTTDHTYLTDCTFQVTWNSSMSKPLFLQTGVP